MPTYLALLVTLLLTLSGVSTKSDGTPVSKLDDGVGWPVRP